MIDFNKQVVLVTGGGRGIGRAICQAFAEAGAFVAINYRSNTQEAEKTLASLKGANHALFQMDLTETGGAESLVGQVVERYGALNILVNNAGIFEAHPVDQMDFDTWRAVWNRTMDVNLNAVADLSYWAAQQMIKQKRGCMVNISSRGAFRGEPNHPAYGASKAGLNSMSQSLAQALAQYNIRVAVVAPGFVYTDMTAAILDGPEGEAIKNQSPLHRAATPQEIAKATVLLAAPDFDYATGAILDVNRGSYLR